LIFFSYENTDKKFQFLSNFFYKKNSTIAKKLFPCEAFFLEKKKRKTPQPPTFEPKAKKRRKPNFHQKLFFSFSVF